jgi:hypothetical protein
MKLPLTSFVRYKYLVESIQDELWSLVEAMMDSPVSIPHHKGSISVTKAIHYICLGMLEEEEIQPTLDALSDNMEAIFKPFMSTLVKKQFPYYTLSGINQRENDKNKLFTFRYLPETEKAVSGFISAAPSILTTRSYPKFIVHCEINIIKNTSSPETVKSTIFHELIHFYQGLMVNRTNSNDRTPPELKYFDPIIPNLQYDDSFHNSLPYAERPREIEAFNYEKIYPILNVKSDKNPNYFKIIDQVCTNIDFLDNLHIAINFIHNKERNSTGDSLQNYANDALDEIGLYLSPHGIEANNILKYKKSEALQFVIDSLIKSIINILDSQKNVIDYSLGIDNTGQSGLEWLLQNNPEKDKKEITQVYNKFNMGSLSVVQDIVSNFVYSNLTNILNQIKNNVQRPNLNLDEIFNMQ